MKIKAVVTHRQGETLRIEDAELREPREDEVLVKIVATGVCHTDVLGRDIGMTPYPVVLGHEGAGIVEKTGEFVTSVEPGDHVVLSFAYCNHCVNCLKGHPANCVSSGSLNFGGRFADQTTPLRQGDQELSTFFGQASFATYSVVKETSVVKVDKDVDLTLLGGLGCGLQTGSGTVLNRLKPEFGTSIVIYGAGAVGLSAIMGAKLTGCANIIAVDIHDNRLALAKELGATHTINSQTEDIEERIKEITGGGAEYGLDSTGVPSVVRAALRALIPMGTLAVVGLTPEMPIDIHAEIMSVSKSLIGVVEGDSVPQLFIPRLVSFYKQGRFPIDKLVKHYDFEDINQAFADSANGSVIKPVVKIG
ncbi:NAD(P)-dependent alcohol dehydrogenase [Streptococcus caviae]|uniref:NAD(P)-dependent alcohol dehydrogenase n=1 Tax=Streptococcus sp. 'caviae' TaxID=1915004 RepID=UPI00094BAC89|nr:NAD(P)-dependent alcohol dehydrogenase [Streptococcus sp. 'caviae']OLN84100.1 aryl-alcohol dehydrogenase [Streptococcus sp. 'caviae']